MNVDMDRLAHCAMADFAVLHAFGNEWASAYAQHLASAASAHGMIASTYTWIEGVAEDVRRAVRRLKTGGVSVVVFMCFEVDIAALITEAHESGLLQDGFVWVAVESSVWHGVASADKTLRPLLAQVLSFEVPQQQWKRFARGAARDSRRSEGRVSAPWAAR